MTRTLMITTLVLGTLGAGTAFASEEACNVPMSDWQPREKLQQKLEQEGWKIRRIKTDDGCYEVYGFDKDGRRMEAYFNPETFAMVRGQEDD
ncbi:MAG: PepSY domain-containing protein [Gammaproteobacteria bacterium]|nr:PepSY domain-containing protein [Gammaproteobacteria bacterium]